VKKPTEMMLLAAVILLWTPGVLAQATGEETEGSSKGDQTPETTNLDGEQEKDQAKSEETPFQRPFAGTLVYWNNEFTAISLDKSHDYTWDPVYSMSFGVMPVWAPTPNTSLTTDIQLTTELTDSDYANKKGEVFLNDIPLTFKYKYKYKINDDVSFNTYLKLTAVAPTSKMAQYETLYTALGIGTRVGFTFPKVLAGLSISWDPHFFKYFHESANPKSDKNPLDESAIPETEKNTSVAYQSLAFGDSENPSWAISNGLNLSLAFIDELSFAFGYKHTYVYKYSPSDKGQADDSSCVGLPQGCEGARDTGHNERGIYMQAFTYGLDYTPWDVITFSLGATTASNQLGPNGQYRTPFFNRETTINFGISLDIDAMVSGLSGSDEGEAGKK
jgi:hypothetical protein